MSAYRERLLGLLGSDDPFDVLTATPALLSDLVDRLGKAGIERSVAPGKWTARQIVAHLADVEQAIGFRVRQIVTAAPGTSSSRSIRTFGRALTRSWTSEPPFGRSKRFAPGTSRITGR